MAYLRPVGFSTGFVACFAMPHGSFGPDSRPSLRLLRSFSDEFQINVPGSALRLTGLKKIRFL